MAQSCVQSHDCVATLRVSRGVCGRYCVHGLADKQGGGLALGSCFFSGKVSS